MKHTKIAFACTDTIYIADGKLNEKHIAYLSADLAKERRVTWGEFIVTACNAYYKNKDIIEELVKACKDAKMYLQGQNLVHPGSNDRMIDRMEAAIAKAKEQQ